MWKLQVGMKHAFYVQCTFTTNMKTEKTKEHVRIMHKFSKTFSLCM